MEEQVIEGPWDEVLLRSEELAGKRVRVTVLTEPPARRLDETLEGFIEAAEQLSRSVRAGGAEPTGSWGDQVVEKFRAQGFEP